MDLHFKYIAPLAALACGLAACKPGPQATPAYDAATGALVRIDYDYNVDGVVDVRTFMQRGRVERLEGDGNGDGRVDRWEYYAVDGRLERIGASRAGDGREDSWAYPSGRDVRVDISTHRDGVIDRREYLRDDVLMKTETDTNRDGVMDTWEQYDSGRLAMWLVDEQRTNGRPTRRLVYSGGAAPRVEVDVKGDGHFEPVIGGTSMPDGVESRGEDLRGAR